MNYDAISRITNHQNNKIKQLQPNYERNLSAFHDWSNLQHKWILNSMLSSMRYGKKNDTGDDEELMEKPVIQINVDWLNCSKAKKK